MKLLLLLFVLTSGLLQAKDTTDKPVLTFSPNINNWTSFHLTLPPNPNQTITATCILKRKGELLGRFPLRKMETRDKSGKLMINFSCGCLAKELIEESSIALYIKNGDGSKATTQKFPLASAAK